MAVVIGVGRAIFDSSKTVGQTFDITGALGGVTPEAALFFYSLATADATAWNQAATGVGACDGTRQWASPGVCQNGVVTTNANHRFRTDECVVRLTSTGTIAAEANFQSFIANGVRLTVGDVDTVDWLITAVFFAGGADLEVYAGFDTLHATVDTAKASPDTGFEPDMVIVACPGVANLDTNNVHNLLSYGVAVNDGTPTQKSWVWGSQDNAGAADLDCSLLTNRVGGQSNLGGGHTYTVELSGFDAAGFDLTPRTGGGQSDYYGFLALKFTGQSVWAGEVDTPVTAIDVATSGLGFQPQFVGLGLTGLSATDTVATDGTAGTIGVGVMDASAEYSSTWQDEDGQTTADTQSFLDSKAINLPPDDGSTTQDLIATLGPSGSGAFDADGFTLNFSATDTGTVRKLFAFAVGPTAAAGAYTLEPNLPTYTITGPNTDLLRDVLVSLNLPTYSITGLDATLTAARIVTPNLPTYSITGPNTTLTHGYHITANLPTYTITGLSVDLIRAIQIIPDLPAYIISGGVTQLSYSETIPSANKTWPVRPMSPNTLISKN